MNLIILGLPGAGKGTQAQKLSDTYGIPHISMGDILRNNKEYETDSGETVGDIIDRGDPVEVETLAALLSARLDEPDAQDGFVLDGFPRTREQAEAMSDIADIDAILVIKVSDENIYERLTGRRVCPDCGAQYHVTYDPPGTEGTCDECGASLVQREDDTREAIAERIRWQREGLEEVRDFYSGTGLIEDIDGDRSIDAVWESVQEVVNDL